MAKPEIPRLTPCPARDQQPLEAGFVMHDIKGAADPAALLDELERGTLETRAAMRQMLRDNLDAHFSGRPLPTPVI